MLRAEPAAIQIGGVGVCTVRTEIAVAGIFRYLPSCSKDLLLQALEQDVEILREDRRRLVDIDAETLELELLAAGADTELQAPVRDDVGVR